MTPHHALYDAYVTRLLTSSRMIVSLGRHFIDTSRFVRLNLRDF